MGNRERIPRAKRVAEGDALAGVGTGNVANVETANTNSLNSAIPHFHIQQRLATNNYLCVATTSSSSAYVGLM